MVGRPGDWPTSRDGDAAAVPVDGGQGQLEASLPVLARVLHVAARQPGKLAGHRQAEPDRLGLLDGVVGALLGVENAVRIGRGDTVTVVKDGEAACRSRLINLYVHVVSAVPGCVGQEVRRICRYRSGSPFARASPSGRSSFTARRKPERVILSTTLGPRPPCRTPESPGSAHPSGCGPPPAGPRRQ